MTEGRVRPSCSTTAHYDRDRMGWVAYAQCSGSALRENEREARKAAHVASCPLSAPARTTSEEER
jgi:hypothetical protein